MWIVNAERAREMDRRATEEFGVPAMVLMERAGLSLFSTLQEMLPEGGRIAVLCGKGNNGGDGFALARLALESGAYGVDCIVSCPEEELGADCKVQCDVAKASGLRPIFSDDARWQKRLEMLRSNDLLFDALLGTGAKGHIHGHIQQCIRAINRSGVPVISVDVPSGIHTDSGEDMGESVWALRTVTFGLPKPCLFQGIGLEHAGYWTVADIGYPTPLLESGSDARLIESDWIADLLPERLRTAHKRDNGHVLVIAGSNSMPGAAMLACLGALRSGAGLVTLASTAAVCNIVAHQLPEVIHLPLDDMNGFLDARSVPELLKVAGHCDSAVIGPGMGQAESVRQFLRDLWMDWTLPTCIDADALNAISAGVPPPSADCVFTPHPGEMGRLLNSSIAEVQVNRFETARTSALKFGKTMILKGPHSIIGSPDEPVAVNTTGNPGMATAGMGDVLSGVVGALLALDLPPHYAACAATYWHGLAGDICADTIGPIGFIASDVAARIPVARAKLVESCQGRSRVRSLRSCCSS